MADSFCGKCGSAVVDPTDSFCRKCGAPLGACEAPQGSPRLPGVAPLCLGDSPPPLAVRSALAAPAAVSYHHPWWPWVLVTIGVLLATFFAFVALASYGDLQVQGLGLFGGELPPSRMDAPISAADASASQQTRDAVVGSAVFASLGLLLVIIGLFAAVVFHPRIVPVPSAVGAVSPTPRPKPTIRPGRLRVAAWLTLGGAALEIPMTVASQLNPSSSGLVGGLLTFFFGLFYIFSYVYALLWLKRLLNAAWDYYSADRILKWMIGISAFAGGGEIVFGIVAMLTPPTPQPPSSFEWWILALLAPFAMLYVGLGIRLLKVPGELYGLKRPLGYLTIADGLSSFLALWAAGAVIAGVITAVGWAILGLVLLRGARVPSDGEQASVATA